MGKKKKNNSNIYDAFLKKNTEKYLEISLYQNLEISGNIKILII